MEKEREANPNSSAWIAKQLRLAAEAVAKWPDWKRYGSTASRHPLGQ